MTVCKCNIWENPTVASKAGSTGSTPQLQIYSAGVKVSDEVGAKIDQNELETWVDSFI